MTFQFYMSFGFHVIESPSFFLLIASAKCIATSVTMNTLLYIYATVFNNNNSEFSFRMDRWMLMCSMSLDHRIVELRILDRCNGDT